MVTQSRRAQRGISSKTHLPDRRELTENEAIAMVTGNADRGLDPAAGPVNYEVDPVVVDGVTFLPFTDVRMAREALSYEPSPGDVILATFPKSGTTWCQYLIWGIHNLKAVEEGRMPPVQDLLTKHFPYIDLVVLELAKFLNADAAARLETERGLLERLLEQTSIERLRELTGGAENFAEGDFSRQHPTAALFRKGVVGDWRSLFDRDQESRFREAYDLALAGTEMHDLWAEYVAPST